MTRISAALTIFFLMCLIAVAQSVPSSVTITWLGHATFVMDTSTGLKVLLDPTNPGAYNPPPVEGVDVITITHEHGDHNYIQMATGNPLVIRGLTQDGFAEIDQTIRGVHIRTVPAYHDNQKGAQRGRNALFIFEIPGLRIAHLGDLGHKLEPQQVSAVGPIDILMTPVAGGPTIDPKTAMDVIDQLKAKVVIPMHYATAAMAARSRPAGEPGAAGTQGERAGRSGPSMAGVDEFLKLLDPTVKVEQGAHQITFVAGRLPTDRTVTVMKYE